MYPSPFGSRGPRTLLDLLAHAIPDTATPQGVENTRRAMAQVPCPMSRLDRERWKRGYSRGIRSRRQVPGRQTPAYIAGWHFGLWTANDQAAISKRGWRAI